MKSITRRGKAKSAARTQATPPAQQPEVPPQLPARIEPAKLTKEKILEAFDVLGVLEGATEKAKFMFVAVCQEWGLNPLKRQIHAATIRGKLVPIVGYEFYIRRAEMSGRLVGWTTDETGAIDHTDWRKSTYAVTVTIHRRDWVVPFRWTAYYAGSVGLKEGRPNEMWSKNGWFQTAKCAISQGFRLAFPDELSGVPYTEAETDGYYNPDDTSDTKDVTPPKQEPQPVAGVTVNEEGVVQQQPALTLDQARKGMEALYREMTVVIEKDAKQQNLRKVGPDSMRRFIAAAKGGAGDVVRLNASLVEWDAWFRALGNDDRFAWGSDDEKLLHSGGKE